MKKWPAALVLTAAALPVLSQTPPPFTSSAGVTLVEVPVHVAGKNGLPVRGLMKDDFELFDDGKRVEVRDMEVVDLENFARDVATGREIPLPPAARRHFLLLFDLSFSTPVKLARGRDAARDFVLNGLKNGDFGAVATLDVEKGLKLVLAFTADRDQLAYAVGTLGLPSLTTPMADPLALTVFSPGDLRARDVSGGGTPGDAEMVEILESISRGSRANFEAYQRGRVDRMMVAMSDLARTLNSVHGRKHIIYFSEGVDSKLLVGDSSPSDAYDQGNKAAFGEIWKIDNDARFGNVALQDRFQQVFSLFNRSDCVFHSVDIAGIRGRGGDARAASSGDTTSDDVTGSRSRGQESLFMMAQATGGEVFRDSNDVESHLERIERQTSLIYLLVFHPAQLSQPGRFHALKVKVHAPGARISARSGYYEPRPFSALTPMEKRLATAQLIAYGLPKNDIPARVLAAPFRIPREDRAVVPIIIEVPGERLLADQVGDRLKVELYAYVTDRQLRVQDFLSQQIGFDLAIHRKTLESGGVKYYGTLFLKPGDYWVKVLVRNPQTGHTGLQIVPITVPKYDRKDLFVLPPLFREAPGRWMMVKAPPRPGHPNPGGYPFVFQGESFIPTAGPSLGKGETASICLVAYGASGTGPLEVEGRVVGIDGNESAAGKLTFVKADRPEPEGLRRLLYSFETATLQPGAYSLVVTVRDSVSGQEGQSALAFAVR